VEGPHLYRRNGYYYLLMAEGGTGLNHSEIAARSRSITGPHEPCPWNPILTARDDPTLPLQKAGHADIVETPKGEWYMVHLCGRPIPSSGRCTLGRETCIQKIEWTDDGWIRLEGGGNTPRVNVPAPDLPESAFPPAAARDHFDSARLGADFQSLRVPLGENSLSLTERPGFLRLKGRESLCSKHHQSLVARRWQAFRFTAETCLEFAPQSFQQMAGLVCLYDVQNWYYLRVTRNEKAGRCLGIADCINGDFREPVEKEARLEDGDRVHLRVTVDYDKLRFHYSRDGLEWIAIGPVLDASRLSDERSNEGRFTGAFVGMCCQDLTGEGLHADFDYFEYRERDCEEEGKVKHKSG
jgi:xylan 1,4-beta-xylosidase